MSLSEKIYAYLCATLVIFMTLLLLDSPNELARMALLGAVALIMALVALPFILVAEVLAARKHKRSNKW